MDNTICNIIIIIIIILFIFYINLNYREKKENSTTFEEFSNAGSFLDLIQYNGEEIKHKIKKY